MHDTHISTSSHFENGLDVTAYLMLGRMERQALLSVHRKIRSREQKGAVETLTLIKRRVIVSSPFPKWDEFQKIMILHCYTKNTLECYLDLKFYNYDNITQVSAAKFSECLKKKFKQDYFFAHQEEDSIFHALLLQNIVIVFIKYTDLLKVALPP